MRKVILYTAASLDGYIAKQDGNIDWLFNDDDYGYDSFIESIDTILFGNNTLKQILTLGEFPYAGLKSYVFSRNSLQDSHCAEVITSNISEFVSDLKQKDGHDIWLVGGGQINTILLQNNLIDKLILSIHPIVLGVGIPLFAGKPKAANLVLIKSQSYASGLVQITYTL